MTEQERFITLNGIQLSVAVEGNENAPPILLLHGFPDSRKVWRKVIPHLVQAGYQVISFDQRGYGKSDAPPSVNEYIIEKIVGDAISLLDALNINIPVNVMGHDWGSLIGWELCLRNPERIRRYVAVSVGHPLAYRSAGWRQKLKGWYVLAFQIPGWAERMLSAANFKRLRKMAPDSEEAENWVADMSRSGRLTAAINWYRANFKSLMFLASSKCKVPVMGVYSPGDVALTEDQMINSEKYMQAEWNYTRIENSSHWIPIDQPELLAKAALHWFATG